MVLCVRSILSCKLSEGAAFEFWYEESKAGSQQLVGLWRLYPMIFFQTYRHCLAFTMIVTSVLLGKSQSLQNYHQGSEALS